MPKKDCVYVDESGINKYLQRKHARSIKEVQVYGAISGLRYARESFIAAKIESHLLAPFCYTGTCHTKLFNICLKDFLIPELKPGQVVMRDNASFHKSQESQRLIEKAGCKILFLPPHSPDLNSIEIFWANFKRILQTNLEKLKTLAEAIDFSF
ncbi:transposase [Candidatus Protochlamydia amoebophila]|uniref:transposase n=1 Tax=Candidatus Protochlamydia amoebophila TaxID=362787 RepID=UPI0005807548|nr:transposase [Candidatus Protochlamydia amoebophila]